MRYVGGGCSEVEGGDPDFVDPGLKPPEAAANVEVEDQQEGELHHSDHLERVNRVLSLLP